MKKFIYIAKPDYAGDYRRYAAFENRNEAVEFAKRFILYSGDKFDPEKCVIAVPVLQFADLDDDTVCIYSANKPVAEIPTDAEHDEDVF